MANFLFVLLLFFNFFYSMHNSSFSRRNKKNIVIAGSISAVVLSLIWLKKNKNSQVNPGRTTSLLKKKDGLDIIQNENNSHIDKKGDQEDLYQKNPFLKGSPFIKKIRENSSYGNNSAVWPLERMISLNNLLEYTIPIFYTGDESINEKIYVSTKYVRSFYFLGIFLQWLRECQQEEQVSGFLDLYFNPFVDQNFLGSNYPYTDLLGQGKSEKDIYRFVKALKFFSENENLQYYSTVLFSKRVSGTIQHFVCLAIDKKLKKIYLLNSLGNGYFDKNTFLPELKKRIEKVYQELYSTSGGFENYDSEYIGLNLQPDGRSCGSVASELAKAFSVKGLEGCKRFLTGIKNKTIIKAEDFTIDKIKNVTAEENILEDKLNVPPSFIIDELNFIKKEVFDLNKYIIPDEKSSKEEKIEKLKEIEKQIPNDLIGAYGNFNTEQRIFLKNLCIRYLNAFLKETKFFDLLCTEKELEVYIDEMIEVFFSDMEANYISNMALLKKIN